MMLGLNGQPSDRDTFAYFLALQIGCQVGDLDRMPLSELTDWRAYFTVKHSIEAMQRKAAIG